MAWEMLRLREGIHEAIMIVQIDVAAAVDVSAQALMRRVSAYAGETTLEDGQVSEVPIKIAKVAPAETQRAILGIAYLPLAV